VEFDHQSGCTFGFHAPLAEHRPGAAGHKEGPRHPHDTLAAADPSPRGVARLLPQTYLDVAAVEQRPCGVESFRIGEGHDRTYRRFYHGGIAGAIEILGANEE